MMTEFGVLERGGDAVGVDGDLLALDLHRRAGGAAEAAEDDRDEVAVHRLAHDVGEDRARGADERAGDDQQVVRQREADRGRRPARVAVEHRDDDRHVGAADRHDQVPADEAGDERDEDHRPDAGAGEVEDAEEQAKEPGADVDQVPVRQGQRLRGDLPGELAVGDDRAGEGDGADQDAEEDLDAHDRELGRGLVGEGSGEAGQRLGRAGRECSRRPGRPRCRR